MAMSTDTPTTPSPADMPAHRGRPDTPAAPAADATAPAADTRPEGNGEELSAEALRAELEQTRREAARYRTQRNELRPLAEKYRQAEDAKKTEAEKAAERIAALEAENRRMQLAQATATVAAEHKLPGGVLRGESEEELAAHAEAIRGLIDSAVTEAVKHAAPYAPVVPEENNGGTPNGATDWLRDKLRGSR